MSYRGKDREVNIEPGFVNSLHRLYLIIRAGLEEARDPIVGNSTWTWNFRDGVEGQNYWTRKALTERSMKRDRDTWNYDKHNGLFIKTDKVHVALVLPTWNPKYIHAFSESGREVVAAMPVGLHADIAGIYNEMTGERLHSITGGRTERSDGKLRLYGRSVQFGPADHKHVADLLNKLGISAEVKENEQR